MPRPVRLEPVATAAAGAGANSRPIIALLRAKLDTLKPAERLIGEAVLADPERVITTAISELADRAGTSVGSVIAFCRRMGVDGFAAFKIALARDLSRTEVGEVAGDAKGSRIGAVFALHAQSLADTLSLNSEADIERAAQLIAKARRVEIFAMGLSYPVAYAAHCKFSLVNIYSSAHFDSHMQVIGATNLGQGDVAFGISCPGNTREVNHCLEVSRAKGAHTICLTNTVGSQITQFSDISLFAAPSETNYYKTSLVARITQLAMIDTLFAFVAQGHDGRIKSRKRNKH
jgi:RpiR family carbohydrate utilization transcriptional regulator